MIILAIPVAILLCIAVGKLGGGKPEHTTKVGGAVLQAVEIPPRRDPPALSGMGPMVAGIVLGLAFMWVVFG
jgi:hypothetical protein